MFGLSFLSPAFLVGSVLAAVPIALHLLGRRPRLQLPFPAVRLLARMPAEQTRRRKVRDVLLLVLRVAALVLLAVGFARPYLAGTATATPRGAVVVAIDCSFSMSAPGQFERARAAARAAVNEVPAATPVGIVSFDDEAAVVVRPTTDRAALRQALERVRSGFGATSYSAALARSADLLGHAPGRIVVVTDLQRTGWNRHDAAIPAQVDVRVRDVGGVPSNLAVSDLRREDDKVVATLRNSGTTMRVGKVRLNVAGHVQAVQPFTLAGGAVQRIEFDPPPATSGEMSAELDDPSGYQGDNKAYALLDPPEAPSLLALTAVDDGSRGAFYLRQALEVDDRRFFRLDMADTGSFSRMASSSYLGRYAAVLVLATRGLDAAAASALHDYVGAGGGMLVAMSDQVDSVGLDALLQTQAAVRIEGTAARLGLLVSDSRHPLMQPLGAGAFAGARFERIARAEVAGQEVLARFGDGAPALSEIRRGSGRVLLFGSDLGNRWNDLPLQPAFLPLVHELARYLVGRRASGREFSVAQVPAGVPREPGVRIVAARGATAPTTTNAGRKIVVNVDSAESDTARMTVAEFEAAIDRRAVPAHGPAANPFESAEQQRIWRALLALAIVVLMAEGALGRTAKA
ncbi:MAG: VWA domain-containing protein [Bacteroidales bacterium]